MLKYHKVIFFIVPLFFLLSIFAGLNLTPDSWAYIDGGLNLASGKGYFYNCNYHPVTLFAPGYSLLLCFFFTLFGTTTLAIFIANSVMFILFNLLLYHLFLKKSPGSIILLNQLVLNFIFARYFCAALSEAIFLPLFICWIYMINREHKTGGNSYLFISIILAEMLLVGTRYAGILLIISMYGTFFIMMCYQLFRKESIRAKDLLVFIRPVVAVLMLVVIRYSLGSAGGKHQFLFGSGKFNWYEYPLQVITDIGTTVFGQAASFQLEKHALLLPLGLLTIILCGCLFSIKINKLFVAFLAVCIVVHIVFLSNVWVDDPLKGRYFLWFYLILILFAQIKVRQVKYAGTINWYKTGIGVFIAFQVLDFSYGSYQKYVTVWDRDHIGFLKPGMVFKGENTYSDNIFDAHLNKDLPVNKIISPCYRWNLIRKK